MFLLFMLSILASFYFLYRLLDEQEVGFARLAMISLLFGVVFICLDIRNTNKQVRYLLERNIQLLESHIEGYMERMARIAL